MNNKHHLFKISEDSSESTDVYSIYPEVAKALQKKMDQWDAQNEPARWGWNKQTCPHFIGYRDFKTEADLIAQTQKKKKRKK